MYHPLSFGIFSQGGLWTPKYIATALWLDASDTDTITESSGAVSQWDDKSGNGRHVSQATGSKQPGTGTQTINGLNVLSWGTTTNDKSLNNTAYTGANWQDVYVVAEWDGTGNLSSYPGLFTGYDDTGTADGIGAIGEGDNLFSSTKWWNTVYSYGTALSAPYAIYPAWDSPFFMSFSANSSISVKGCSIGQERAGDGVADRGWRGKIAEVVAFNSKLSDDNRYLMEGYLAWKWGMQASLPGGHPYEDAAPTV